VRGRRGDERGRAHRLVCTSDVCHPWLDSYALTLLPLRCPFPPRLPRRPAGFLRHLAASLQADVAVTGADEARLSLEMLTKALLFSPDAYLLTLQALLGLPARRLSPRK
jgi:hypothetical protein